MSGFRSTLRAAIALACIAMVFPGAPATSAAEGATPHLSDGLDLSNLDRTCPACKNFYQFADGRYAATHPIPPDRPGVDSFDTLSDAQLNVLHGILEATAADASLDPNSDDGKLATYYRSCMNSQATDAAGLAPLQPELAKIESVHDVPSLTAELASLQRLGVGIFYDFASEANPKHSQDTIAGLSDGDLGLPDRDYYLATDAKSVQTRADYVKYLADFLAVTGSNAAPARLSPEAAAANAVIAGAPGAATAPGAASASAAPEASAPATGAISPADILAFETSLAKLQPTRAERRDPVANYHYVTFDSLQGAASGIDWHAYFATMGAPSFAHLDVARPLYIIAATKILVATPLPLLKTYMRERLIANYAYTLSAPIYASWFAFYRTNLDGIAKPRPQWQRCAIGATYSIQDLVSVVYAKKAFTPAAKARAVALITNIHGALRSDLKTLPWMTPRTRARAQRKLSLMVKKIGYPDHPRDYSQLVLSPGPFAQQELATTAFGTQTDYDRIGKPTNRTLWGMAAPEVNAYYNDSDNEIVFPAGILGHPFYDPKADDAVNYGGIGVVMGHETTHGFDDGGRQFDEYGNLEDWWQKADAARFKTRAACIVKQFSSYTISGVHLNGSATQGEAIADLGGATLAFRAFERTPEAKAGMKIGGFTPEQRFFLSFAQVWAENQRAAAARQQALTDPHPPGMWRVIGTLSNMPEFQKAFHCKNFDAMVRKARCRIW